MPGTITTSRDNAGHVRSALRDLLTNYNNLVLDMEVQRFYETSDSLACWLSGANSTASPMAIASTDTQVATGSFNYVVAGLVANKAGVAGGTALASGTLPQNTWGVWAFDIASGGTITCTAGAGNAYGYATEAAALAAIPSPVTAKARIGVVTVLAPASSSFVPGTNSLAGGASTPAQTTNYYPTFGTQTPTGNRNGVGGANGILIGNVALAKGGTDTNLANTSFTYNANGITNLAKGAVSAGTAFGSLGTIPASTWGLIVAYVDATGAISFQSAPNNYTTGYATEAQARMDLNRVTQPAGKARMGYVTIQASASTWRAGTDALAGGASGNPATTTNYYSQPGQLGGLGSLQPYQQSMLASQIGSGPSGVLGDLTEAGVSNAITATNSGG